MEKTNSHVPFVVECCAELVDKVHNVCVCVCIYIVLSHMHCYFELYEYVFSWVGGHAVYATRVHPLRTSDAVYQILGVRMVTCVCVGFVSM